MKPLEQWILLTCLKIASKDLFSFSIELTNNGSLTIYFRPKFDALDYHVVTFPAPIYSYRTTDETFRIELTHGFAKKYGRPSTYFSEVINSEYKKELGDAFALPVRHFAIMVDDVVIDILGTHEPHYQKLQVKRPIRYVAELYHDDNQDNTAKPD